VAVAARAFLGRVEGPVSKLGPEDVRGFLAARQAAGVSAVTQAGELSHLRTFFTALVRLGLAPADPTDGLRVRRPPPKPHRLVTEGEVARLLAAASASNTGGKLYRAGCAKRDRPDLRPREVEPFLLACARRDRAALELLYGLGLRSSEVSGAMVLDLDLTAGSLLVRRAKRGQPERLPLPPSSLPHLRAWLGARPLLARGAEEGRLLLRNDGRPYVPVRGINKLLASVARRAGVVSVHPHALRRAVASHLVRAGAPILAVQQLLGHAELTTTQLYVEVEREDLRRAVETLEAGGARSATHPSCSISVEVQACSGERGQRRSNAH
jgi:integrase/recombinase XerD